ncbi:MAG: ferrous iron transport protein A [Ectobacillus sp.]
MVLTELKRGTQAKIVDLSNVNPIIQRRLLDMGIDEGTTICLKGVLPFRGPCMIEASGQCISLRRSEASCIIICMEEE